MMNLLEEDNQQLDLLNMAHEDIHLVPNVDFYGAIVMNEFMNQRLVEIRDGEVVKEGYLSKYKLYVVRTRKQNSDFDTEVSRRFSDFEWLHQELINKYGGYIIPAIPEKHLLTKVNLESYEFSEKRRKELQYFLQRILNHPQLRYVPELRIFIEDKEKFISLLKGELEQNKTFEQKCGNVVSSFKGFFGGPSSLIAKAQDVQRVLDGSDKDMSSDEQILVSLSLKCSKLQKTVEEFIVSCRDEGKLLQDQNDALSQWNGIGNVTEDDLDQLNLLKKNNEQRQRKINKFVLEADKKIVYQIQQQLIEIDWALMACKRRRNLCKQLIIDQQRIEELKLQYTDNSSRRDIEMDILKTKYQKNRDKSDKMSLIMNEEISAFVQDQKRAFLSLITAFKGIFKAHVQNEMIE